MGLTEGGDVVIVVSDFLDDEGRDPHAHADEIDGGRAVHLFGESLAVLHPNTTRVRMNIYS